MKKHYLQYQVIIVLYLSILLLHYFVHRRYSLYPSLVFPSFSQAPPIKDVIQYQDITLFAITNQNGLIPINKVDFFRGYDKYINYFLATIIKNEKKTRSSPSLLRARLAFLSDSSRRLKKILPKESIKGIMISRSIKSYNTDKMEFISDSRLGHSTVIYLKN